MSRLPQGAVFQEQGAPWVRAWRRACRVGSSTVTVNTAVPISWGEWASLPAVDAPRGRNLALACSARELAFRRFFVARRLHTSRPSNRGARLSSWAMRSSTVWAVL